MMLVAALVAGLLIGALVAVVVLVRTREGERATEPTPAPDATRLLRSGVDQLEIGVVVASGPDEIVYRNRAATSFAGTHIGVLVDAEVSAIIAEALSGVRASRLVELQGPPKTWLAISADPTPDGGAVVTIQDVSERVRTEAMRTDFVTNISHELKTPVGAVAVLAETLIDETDPDVARRLADLLVEESHRTVRTIDDLLELSKIESERPDDTVVDVAGVIQTAIERGRAVDGGRGVTISTVEVPDPILVRGDERQLVSAVGNLVENAVKYSQPGDHVQIRQRIHADAVEITVTDQGIGIPARDLRRIFERFYRVDRARSRETGGTGLGLSIVRHVATNHGGDVVVSSTEGEGSTFVLSLPVSRLVGDQPDGSPPVLSNDGATS